VYAEGKSHRLNEFKEDELMKVDLAFLWFVFCAFVEFKRAYSRIRLLEELKQFNEDSFTRITPMSWEFHKVQSVTFRLHHVKIPGDSWRLCRAY